MQTDIRQNGARPVEHQAVRYCGRQRTSPYSPDLRSSMAGNAEEDLPILSPSCQSIEVTFYTLKGHVKAHAQFSCTFYFKRVFFVFVFLNVILLQK